MKKCPYCDQLLNDVVFKCQACKNWVDNDTFRRLGNDDIELIKSKDLVIFTPKLITLQLLHMLLLDLQSLKKEASEKTQMYNLLAFKSFCYFRTLCLFAKMKQGQRQPLVNILRDSVLQGVAELFRDEVDQAVSVHTLIGQGKVLYQQIDTVMSSLNPDVPSQVKASTELASVVFPDGGPDLIEGWKLYMRFMNMFEHMGKHFSKIFLVEEEDFD